MKNFWSKVRKSSGCWIWTAALTEKGYGVFCINGRTDKAHRIAYRLMRGEIPKGKWVLHRCDVPACVNPKHLFIGTSDDNITDMHLKGRAVPPPNMGGWNRLALNKKILSELGKKPDYLIAAKYGVSKRTILRRRQALNIPSYASQTGNSGKFFVGMEHPRWGK